MIIMATVPATAPAWFSWLSTVLWMLGGFAGLLINLRARRRARRDLRDYQAKGASDATVLRQRNTILLYSVRAVMTLFNGVIGAVTLLVPQAYLRSHYVIGAAIVVSLIVNEYSLSLLTLRDDVILNRAAKAAAAQAKRR